MLMRIRNNRRKKKHLLDPNDVFLDSSNLPEFNTHQFEGRIEKPISKLALFLTGGVFFAVFFVFSWKTWGLQITSGEAMRERGEENRLEHSIVFSARGTITDRRGEKLAWNALPQLNAPKPKHLKALASSTATSTAGTDGNADASGSDDKKNASSTTDGMTPLDEESLVQWQEKPVEEGKSLNEFFSRRYVALPGLAHTVGYVKYPAKDKSGVYYEAEYKGFEGAEQMFDTKLSGKNGLKIREVDALGAVESESAIEDPVPGEDVTLSIDAGVQSMLYDRIADLAGQVDFKGGAGVVMDVNTGEILAMASYPEYDPSGFTEGDAERIAEYNADPRTPLINRAVHGLYSPGSIVKPIMAIAALAEGIISPEKEILSTGSISIPNPYFPDQPSVFRDWKAHGYVNMRRAIAVSSDVYFYTIGGGYGAQAGLGIARIKKYMRDFGFGEKTGLGLSGEEEGVLPDPEWKAKMFDGEAWRLGDTYHTVIGQYGMQVTPIQAVRAAAALANDGVLVTPTLLASSTPKIAGRIDIPANEFKIVKEGMRLAVLEGTAAGLNAYDVHVAGKTGTAELGSRKQFVNSWVIGFFPYEKPRYAFAVVMERGPASNLTGATYVMRQVLDWMARERPEYLKSERE